MNKAVEFAREMLRQSAARQKSKSKKLRRDYAKAVRNELGALVFYCQSKGIDLGEVLERAKVEETRNNGEREKPNPEQPTKSDRS